MKSIHIVFGLVFLIVIFVFVLKVIGNGKRGEGDEGGGGSNNRNRHRVNTNGDFRDETSGTQILKEGGGEGQHMRQRGQKRNFGIIEAQELKSSSGVQENVDLFQSSRPLKRSIDPNVYLEWKWIGSVVSNSTLVVPVDVTIVLDKSNQYLVLVNTIGPADEIIASGNVGFNYIILKHDEANKLTKESGLVQYVKLLIKSI
jgi:hypothetical protein